MPKINTEYDIGKAFQAIEDELIASYIRNLEQHKIDEVDEKKQWSMWQVEQLHSLEKYKKENKKKYEKQFKDINDQIEELIRVAKEEGDMEQEIQILNAIKKGFPAKKLSKGATAEFFKLNERKLEALIKATREDMKKAETAILRMANDQYRKVIYNAQVYANTGAGTYEKAVDMATKDFLAAGINCIEYANGARHTLADYADMAIRTACKRAYLQGEGEMRQSWGISTVIVNKRTSPCPKCLPFVGKVMIDDVWSGGPKDGKSPLTGIKYPLMSKAVEAGLYHPRCKDSHTTYFEGISTPPDDKYTKEELEQLVEQNRQEAKQQYAERQEKKYDRMERFSLDAGNKKRYALRKVEWKEMKESVFSDEKAIKRYGERFSKFSERFEVINFGQKDIITNKSIYKNLNKSHVGKDVIQYIENHPELKIELVYGANNPDKVLGRQFGDEIRIYASETKTVQKTCETLVHEIIHHKYDIGGSQWAECVCKVHEYKHRLNKKSLTKEETKSIIKVIKELYSDLPWR